MVDVALSAEFSRISVAGGARGGGDCDEDEGRPPARLESGRSLVAIALSAEFIRVSGAGGDIAAAESDGDNAVERSVRLDSGRSLLDVAFSAELSRLRERPAGGGDWPGLFEGDPGAPSCSRSSFFSRAALRDANKRRRSSICSLLSSVEEVVERLLSSPVAAVALARPEMGRSLLGVALRAEFSLCRVAGGDRAGSASASDDEARLLDSGRSLVDVAFSAEF